MTNQQIQLQIKKIFQKDYASNKEIENIIKSNLRFIIKSDNEITFNVPRTYYFNIMSNSGFFKKLEQTIITQLNPRAKCEFLCELPKKIEIEKVKSKFVASKFGPLHNANSNLNQKYTFDNFIKAKYNKRCYEACLNAIADLGVVCNPLFIYGHSGLGKTHMLNAFGNKVVQTHPDKKVKLYNAEDFCHDYVDYLFHGTARVEKFKKELNEHDVLLIDDIQFNANKEKTNEVFFNLFENFYKNNKQIVITSDVHPKKLNGFHRRLISRFDSGLTLDLKELDKESIKKIIDIKIKNTFKDKTFEPKAVDYIVDHFNESVRELETAIKRIQYFDNYLLEDNKKINLALIQEIFADIIFNYNPETISIDNIVNIVCAYFHVDHKEIKSNSKKPNVVQIKRIVIYLAKEYLNFTNVKIAKYLNMKSHSSIIKGFNAIKSKMNDSGELQSAITNIKKIIKNQ